MHYQNYIRPHKFLLKYIQFLLVMMILITGAIVVTLFDFDALGESKAASSDFNINAKMESFLHSSAESKSIENVDESIKVSMAETLPRRYVWRGAKGITLAKFVIKNESEEVLKVSDLGFEVENSALAESYSIYDAKTHLGDTEVAANGDASLALDLEIAAGEEKTITLYANIIREARGGDRMRVMFNPTQDLRAKQATEVHFTDEDSHSPFVTVIGGF